MSRSPTGPNPASPSRHRYIAGAVIALVVLVVLVLPRPAHDPAPSSPALGRVAPDTYAIHFARPPYVFTSTSSGLFGASSKTRAIAELYNDGPAPVTVDVRFYHSRPGSSPRFLGEKRRVLDTLPGETWIITTDADGNEVKRGGPRPEGPAHYAVVIPWDAPPGIHDLIVTVTPLGATTPTLQTIVPIDTTK